MPRLNAAVAICRYFPVRRGRLFIVYTFDSKKLTVLFCILKKCDQVQKSGPVPLGLMSLSQAKCLWLNAAVAICQKYRLSEDIALLMYTLIILKTFGPVPLGLNSRSKM